jgi:hypothetical protein
MGFTKDQADTLANSYVTLSSDSESAEEKTKALTDAQAILESSNKTAGATTDAMASSIDDLNWINAEAAKIMGDSTDASDDQNSSIEDGNEKLDKQVDALEKANPKLEKNADKAKAAAKQQEELAKQTGKASDNMADLNTQLDTYNKKSVAPKQVGTVDVNTRSFEIPQSDISGARMNTIDNARSLSTALSYNGGFTRVNTNGTSSNVSIPITINGNGKFTSAEINEIVNEATGKLRRELFRLS